ncbi:hypothetical protein HG535_0A02030 [Zygotorulaspora mrakii]|uniref:Uncharacterized protein n=1 Tax=Zygotorulaspora mrakii TaxID=42260 RepID=A0A7H9AVG2_ZYGMR|nr:uncharacterized protein HG535_0A02030 [Zygotorulaspora mrakii]QLG70265.1 hypothetical protein HG535_0A02030 [Zygotorulaspora mrakii]
MTCNDLNTEFKVTQCRLNIFEGRMSSQGVREAAKSLVKALERFPNERIKHLVSFKQSQMERFNRVAGLQIGQSKDASDSKVSLDDIKDIINRTSAPLGLQKNLLKKMQSAMVNEDLTEQSIKEQISALNTLTTDKYKQYYDVSDKLYKPQGNPQYYKRILDEIEGKKKETFMTALRTVILGK